MIETIASRESALACAIVVVLRVLLDAPPELQDTSAWARGKHPLFDAALVLDAEVSMRLAATTLANNEQTDSLTIMESLSVVM